MQEICYLEDEQKAVPNLRDLKVLSEETIFNNCSQRYYDDYNYTEFGATAMISTNPFKVIKYQSEEAYMKSFNPNKQQTDQVHIYKFGAMAMASSKLKKQVFLIQGESGSGKTKNCEILLKQIASFCNQGKTDQIILSSAPIMEAFGNAKTARNDNSSRFGKFLELNLNESIVSAKYQTYLLEQSRVIKLSKTDKNYHIFYQVLFTQLLDYQAKDFMYLKNGDMNLDERMYQHEYHETLQCMKQQNFPQQKIDQILDIVKGILFLGNLEFKDIGNDQTQIIEDSNLGQVMKYFQMTADHLNLIICTTQAKNIQLARISRDSLAKFIYQNIFTTIVSELNSNLSNLQGKSMNNQIYLLDIFGFEFFEENKIHQNSFEQLNINSTNERLQKQYEKTIIQAQNNKGLTISIINPTAQSYSLQINKFIRN